jgi:hypothetical protein
MVRSTYSRTRGGRTVTVRSWILDGSGSVTLDGNVRIGGIAFYGTTPFTRVPDTGSTLLLLSLALGALLLVGINGGRLTVVRVC